MTCNNVHAPRLTRKEAAHYIDRSPATLEKWASQRRILKYYMVGGRAEYEVGDLDEFKKGKQVF